MSGLQGKKRKTFCEGGDCTPLDAMTTSPPILCEIWKAYANDSGTKGDAGAEGFKNAVMQWSNTYYIAYALLFTVAFAMLLEAPELRQLDDDDDVIVRMIHYRPASERLDAIAVLLYYFFVCIAMANTAWCMVLCSEWQLRGTAPPAKAYPQFIDRLASGNHKIRIATCCGNHFQKNCPDYTEQVAWDPYSYQSPTYTSLFLAGVAFLYVSQGVLHASMVFLSFLVFAWRFRVYGLMLIKAAYKPDTSATTEAPAEDSSSSNPRDGLLSHMEP